MKIWIAILCLGVQGITYAQSTFNKVYPEGHLTTNMVAQGNDMVMASVFTTKMGQLSIRWLRIDSVGTIVQNDSIVLANGEQVHTGYKGSLQVKPNGNYVLVGFTISDAFLLEVTSQFDSVRSRRYNYPNGFRSLIFGSVICANGDIAITGEHLFYPPGDSIFQRGALVARFDSSFSLLWDLYDAVPRNNNRLENIELIGGSIMEMPDSSLIVTGSRYSDYYPDSLTNILFRYDVHGNLIWKKAIGSPTEEDGSAVLLKQTDTSFYVVQSKGIGRFVYGSMNYGVKVITIGAYSISGNMLWEKTCGKAGIRKSVLSFKQVDTSLLVLMGTVDSNTFFSYTSLRGLSLSGDSLWHVDRYEVDQPVPRVSVLYDFASTTSGDLIMGGTAEFSRGPRDYKFLWCVRTDMEGCINAGCHNIGIQEPKQLIEVSVYPNPTSEFFTVEVGSNVSSNEKMLLEISDVSGRVVLTQSIEGNTLNVSTINWGSGIYILKLSSSNTAPITKKIIVDR